MFLSTLGELQGFKEIPGETDLEGQGGGHRTGPRVAPPLNRVDGFGQSLAGYEDLDGNGLREVLVGMQTASAAVYSCFYLLTSHSLRLCIVRTVGAPGDDVNGTVPNAGAVYIMFLRRRRHHWIPFDYVTYWVTIFLPTGCFCCSCISGTIYFFWYFRRRPDEIEIIVKKSGYEMAQERKRYKKASNQVYADNYTA